MMEKQLYNRQYFFIMKISKKNIMYDCVFHTVERSSYMCKKTKEQKFIMLPSVDFCFQELMEDEEVRRGFIGAFSSDSTGRDSGYGITSEEAS